MDSFKRRGSDVFFRLSKEAKGHEILISECIGGALFIEDFRRICHQAGFKDIRMHKKPVEIEI